MSIYSGYYLWFLPIFYFRVYLLAIILLLLSATFLKGKLRTESDNLLYSFNTLTAWASFCLAIFYVSVLFQAWYGQNPYEWYAFDNSIRRAWLFFFIKAFLPVIAGLLFFIRKLRINRVFILIFLILQNLEFFERLIASPKIDVKGFWEMPFGGLKEIVTASLFIVAALACIYFIAFKRKRLPYVSVFLK